MTNYAYPSSWMPVTLGDIATLIRGVTYQKAEVRADAADGFTPLLRATNINRELDFDDMVFVPNRCIRPDQILMPGDLVIATSSGSLSVVGKGAMFNEGPRATFGAFCSVLRPGVGVDPKFVAYFLHTNEYRTAVSSLAAGSNINNLRRGHLEGLPLPLPPLGEQRRIVTALEEHLSALDAAVAGLTRGRINVRRFVDAAIASAVAPRADWPMRALRELGTLKGGVTKGQKRRAGEMVRTVPYLRVANVQRGRLDLRDVRVIEATEREISELRLVTGDVLFNEGGDRDKLGRGWVWNGEIDECIHQNHVFRARLDRGLVEPHFVSHYANSHGQRYFLDQGTQTTNLASISMTKLGAMPVPVPPIEEQQRILASVEEKLAVAERTAAELDVQLARAARLRQSILQCAFSGRLVSQDPADEPAEELLARERTKGAPRASIASPSRGRKRANSTHRTNG